MGEAEKVARGGEIIQEEIGELTKAEKGDPQWLRKLGFIFGVISYYLVEASRNLF